MTFQLCPACVNNPGVNFCKERCEACNGTAKAPIDFLVSSNVEAGFVLFGSEATGYVKVTGQSKDAMKNIAEALQMMGVKVTIE